MRTSYISLKNEKSKTSISSDFLKKRFIIITLGLTYLIGMLFGRSFANGLGESNETMAKLLTGFITNRATQTLWQNFLSSFVSAEICLLILFICGYCAIGTPLVYLTIFFRGLGPGLSMAVIFAQTGWSGASASLIMLPGVIGTAIIIMLAGKISIGISTRLFSEASSRERLSIKSVTPRYCIQYLIFTVFLSVISLLDGLLFYLFSGILIK